MFVFFFSLEVIGSLIRNIGKLYEILVLMILVLNCLFKKVLVSMWSVAVAYVLVTLVGLLIRGIRLF